MEHRKFKRFELRLPVEIVRNGANRISALGETRNLSSRGVLFCSDADIDAAEPIEYIISFPAGEGSPDPVDLHCLGKVIRVSPRMPDQDSGPRFDVAATLERYEFVRRKL